MSAPPTTSQQTASIAGDAALKNIESAVAAGPSARPVHDWNPPFLGTIDIRIAADGTWYHLGTPIRRERLVKLFASILRREQDGTICLVTPAERYAIQVDDVPFLAVEMIVDGVGREQILSFRTNMDEKVSAGEAHPMRFAMDGPDGETRPYIMIRDGLEALVVRSVFYDLVDLGMTHEVDGTERFGVWSAGRFFVMANAAELDL